MKNYISIFVLIISLSLTPIWVNHYNDVALWIRRFSYQSEEGNNDYWKTPEETVKDKGGDCEDFALLTKEVLQNLKYKAYFIAVTQKKRGKLTRHAITILKHEEGGLSFFSNNRYYRTKHYTLRKLLNTNFPAWTEAGACLATKKCYLLIKPLRRKR